MTKTLAYAAQSATTPVAPWQFERRALRPDDVDIEILYCGVCHTDIHMTRDEWGGAIFPMVPGHEIIGRVVGLGSDVTKFQIGDLVGVGTLVDSCGRCSSCRADLEVYCEEFPTSTYGARDRHDGSPTYGGYSQRIVTAQHFVLRLPDGLDPQSAGPLLCAGITTYSPLRHWKVGPGQKVAVVGLGGLGHMGIKFAHAMGAQVTLFTRSQDKAEEAGRLGAANVVISTDDAQMQAAANQFDLILDTVPVAHDVNPYLATLKLNGTLVVVGQLDALEPAVQALSLILNRRSLAGSGSGGIAQTQEMLEFCAEHGVTCDVEMIDIQDINHAFERVIQGDVRYRFVIDMSSLQAGA